MKQTEYKVVADEKDKQAVNGKKPVFEFEGQEYFNGDTFTAPDNFILNMNGFEGRGLKFDYKFSFTPRDENGTPLRDENGINIVKEVERRVILPLVDPNDQSEPVLVGSQSSSERRKRIKTNE